MRIKRYILLLIAFLLSLNSAAPAQEEGRELRGIWAHAWSDAYLTPQTARELVENTRKANLNSIFLQVRKAGDAYYDSSIEPRANNIDKDFDPLQTVIDLAHDTSGGKQRLDVHAWVVVYRVLRLPDGKKRIPRNINKRHILARRPEWLMTNSKGKKSMDGNVFIDPGVPGVNEHTVKVFCEIAKKYDVDGIHLDYVRYPESDSCDWGYNPISLRRFNKSVGRRAKSRPDPDDSKWTKWRRKNVSDFVQRLYFELKAIKPKIKVSAATVAWGEPKYNFRHTKAYKQVLQDWAQWLRKGWLDIAVPMVYKRGKVKTQSRDFDRWVASASAMTANRQVAIGQGSFLNSRYHSGLQIKLLRAARPAGFVLYSYQNPTSGKNPKLDSFISYIQSRYLKNKAGIPKMDWLDTPKRSNACGTVRLKNGAALENLKLRIGRMKTTTDGTGFFVFPNIRPDKYTIEARIDKEWKTVGQVQTKKGQTAKLEIIMKSAPSKTR